MYNPISHTLHFRHDHGYFFFGFARRNMIAEYLQQWDHKFCRHLQSSFENKWHKLKVNAVLFTWYMLFWPHTHQLKLDTNYEFSAVLYETQRQQYNTKNIHITFQDFVRTHIYIYYVKY